jgi:hypothetical protein
MSLALPEEVDADRENALPVAFNDMLELVFERRTRFSFLPASRPARSCLSAVIVASTTASPIRAHADDLTISVSVDYALEPTVERRLQGFSEKPDERAKAADLAHIFT